MYRETYEEYIRSILGYPNYQNNTMESNYQAMPMTDRNNEQNPEIEACYPEIYKVVYPMVNKACNTNTRPITPELIEELTNEIYLSIENDNEINVTINLTNEVTNHVSSEQRTRSSNGATAISNTTKMEKTRENRGREDRQFRNRGLQDLIRILLIRELLGRPGNRPPRPPMPPARPPMRPPFPGGPGQGPRPPIMPRYNEFSNIYEEN